MVIYDPLDRPIKVEKGDKKNQAITRDELNKVI